MHERMLEEMRDRIERLVLLPFSIGCVSDSSIAVGEHFPYRSKNNAKAVPIRTKEDVGEEYEDDDDDDDEEALSDDNLKSPLSLLGVPKFQRLFKNFKNLSQLFAYKDDEMDEDDCIMQIGLPTDVKHLTHIGIDGSTTSILSKGWDDLKAPDHLPVPPAQFKPSLDMLAMPAQVPADLRVHPPTVHDLTPSPPGIPAQVPPDSPAPPVHLTPSPLAVPVQVHQLNFKGA